MEEQREPRAWGQEACFRDRALPPICPVSLGKSLLFSESWFTALEREAHNMCPPHTVSLDLSEVL